MSLIGSEQDPFTGILCRSSVAQALREARASLARPTRPITPACRSLFQQAEDPSVSRPSSSYSIEQLRFVSDTFASTGSDRSGLRSCESCAAIAEDGELEAPDLLLEDLEPEVLTFGERGQVVSQTSGLDYSVDKVGQAKAAEGAVEDDEYDAGPTADDLALQMDVPTDSEASDEEDPSRAGTPASTTALRSKPLLFPGEGQLLRQGGKIRLPPTPTKSMEKLKEKEVEELRGRSSSVPSRKKSEKRASTGERSIEKVMQRIASSCGKALQELEALQQGGSATSPEVIRPLAERLAGLVATDLRAGKLCGIQEKQASNILRTVLSLMDQGVDSQCMLRLAHCALDLLQVGSVVQDVGGQGVAAAYLNVARLLFRLSKDASLDSTFKEFGLVEQLLHVLGSSELHCAATDLRIYVAGILKNLTHNDDHQRFLAKRGALPVLQALMKCSSLLGSAKEVQLLIQVTALLRNLVCSSSRRQTQFVELGMLSDLARVSKMYTSNEELQLNMSRILSKLSANDRLCEVLGRDAGHVQQVVKCWQAHAGCPPLVLRFSFVLGNLAALSEQMRDRVMFECDAISALPMLLERYWRQDRKLAQAEAATNRVVATLHAKDASSRPPRSSNAHDTECVLVKLVRLAANATISPQVGNRLASTAPVVDVLLDILGCKRMPQSEELVLTTTAAITNLLFYESQDNLLFSSENKQLLCRLLRPMLLESYNVEALVEAARALGNLSRHPDARQWIRELRIDEVLCILLGHDDRDLVFYSCGALVNLAADQSSGLRLCESQDLRPKLAALLRDTPPGDEDLMLVAVKVLSNLIVQAEENAEVVWQHGELSALRAGLERACGLSVKDQSEEATVLAGRLLQALPVC